MDHRNAIRDKGGSSIWGLIMAPGQEGNDDNFGKSFLIFYTKNCMLSVLIRIASMRRF